MALVSKPRCGSVPLPSRRRPPASVSVLSAGVRHSGAAALRWRRRNDSRRGIG